MSPTPTPPTPSVGGGGSSGGGGTTGSSATPSPTYAIVELVTELVFTNFDDWNPTTFGTGMNEVAGDKPVETEVVFEVSMTVTLTGEGLTPENVKPPIAAANNVVESQVTVTAAAARRLSGSARQLSGQAFEVTIELPESQKSTASDILARDETARNAALKTAFDADSDVTLTAVPAAAAPVAKVKVTTKITMDDGGNKADFEATANSQLKAKLEDPVTGFGDKATITVTLTTAAPTPAPPAPPGPTPPAGASSGASRSDAVAVILAMAAAALSATLCATS